MEREFNLGFISGTFPHTRILTGINTLTFALYGLLECIAFGDDCRILLLIRCSVIVPAGLIALIRLFIPALLYDSAIEYTPYSLPFQSA